LPLRALLETSPYQSCLSFNIENVDDVFPGFSLGDFAVLYGSPKILPLSLLLCVRAQLPHQLGGLRTNAVFVDGGNTFRLYDASYIAQLHELYPKDALERIFISRAFTAYQMTSIVFDRLQTAVTKYNSKLVIISDIAGLYLDKDVPKNEAKEVFNQLTVYLSNFARTRRVIVVATFFPHSSSKLNAFFREMASGRANVVASVRESKHSQQFILEKHPVFSLRNTCFPSENLSLTKFMGEWKWEKPLNHTE